MRGVEQFLKKLIEESKASIDALDKTIEHAKETLRIGSCPSCGDGFIEERGKFYGCTNYSNGCKLTLPKRWAGKIIPEKQIEKLLAEGKTDVIKGFTSKKGQKFDARLVIKNNKINMQFK